jgi:hypothetical protein
MAATDEPPVAAAIFSGNATEGATAVGASAPERAEATRHGWRVLAILRP